MTDTAVSQPSVRARAMTPKRLRDIDDRVRATLAEAAPEAAAFLRSVVRDTEAPRRCRVDAARTLLDRAGYPAFGKPDDGGAQEISDMDSEELRKFIIEGREELANRSVAVGPAPTVLDADENFMK